MKLKSNEPFWLVKNGIKHSYPSLYENVHSDIVVVGGGITGSLIAHQCIADGYDTILIDRREIANGSTAATTSMLQYEIDVSLHELIEKLGEKGAVNSYRACFDSIDVLQNIVRTVKSSCGFKKKDSLYYAAYKKDVDKLYREYEVRKKYGLPVEWMRAESILKQFGIHHTHGGILSHQGASIDAFCLAHELLHFNHQKGLRIFDKTDIDTVKYSRNRIKVVTEYGYTISAKKIIYCNGFESTELIQENFVKLLSTYALVTEIYPTEFRKLKNILVWNTAEPYHYLRMTDDSRMLIGGEDVEFSSAKRRDSLLTRKTKKLSNTLSKLLPESEYRVDFSWAGTFGETKDGLPYIGMHKDFPGAYFVLGFGGNGITFSVIGMEMVSDFLKGRKHPLEYYFRFGR